MMQLVALPPHPGLADNSRLPSSTTVALGMPLREWFVLLAAGVAAALGTVYLGMGLRIPGHAILRVILPMAFGLAIVPRQMAGTIMGVGALLSGLAMGAGGFAMVGIGAMTSLTLTGPLLDLSVRDARGGSRIYAGFAVAGMASNLLALAARAAAKFYGLDRVGTRPLAAWLPQAVVTYAVCGLLAGLVCAAIWFRFTGRSPAGSREGAR